MDAAREAHRYRFGTFEFDALLLELRRGGRKVRLRPQSLKLLALLVARPGELVSRDDIQAALWDDDTFVDFEQGVNHCIKQLRAGLRDSAQSPRFIETVPRRGYRFIAPVHQIAATEAGPAAIPTTIPQAADDQRAPGSNGVVPAARRHSLLGYSAIVLLGVAGMVAVAVSGRHDVRPASSAATSSPILAVLPFASAGTDSTIGAGLANAISNRLAVQRFVSVRTPRAPVESAPRAPATEIARTAGATLVLTGDLTQNGETITVVTELFDVRTGSRTWTGRFRVQADELSASRT